MTTNKKYLLAILAVAAILRLVNLGAGDINGSDEVFYSFRAVGLLDFDNAPKQTTPLQWFDPNIPWWTHLSMHDHPLLVFLIQHISMDIFGETNFGFRFPSAVLGVISVYVLYLIGRRLFSEKTGLIAAALMAITVNQVYISRVALQEAYAIFFILLGSYLFLKALDEPKYFLWTGAVLGLGLLAKYNTGIIIPIFLTYLLISRRDVFRKKQFWIGVALAAIAASPILIYNLEMYRATGHFDFQISYIFGQKTDAWKAAPGKEHFPTVGARLDSFLPNLVKSNSWIFLALFAASLVYAARKYSKNPRETFRQRAFIDIALAWLVLFIILIIGPSFRFLTMLAPFLIVSTAVFLSNIKFSPRVAVAAAAFLATFEIAYSANSQITDYPAGPEIWVFSRLRYDNYNWGFNELDNYLNKELQDKYPAVTFDLRYQFLAKIKDAALKDARQRGNRPYSAIFIYDGNLHTSPQLWIFGRRQIYHGWPTINAETYLAAPQRPVADNNYFIQPTEVLPVKEGQQFNNAGAILEQKLLSAGIYPISLKNKRGEEVFRVYKFTR